MNERIKELAEQAGLDPEVFHDNQLRLDDFAELVRQDERDKCAQDYLKDCADAVEAARKDERYSCHQDYQSIIFDAVKSEREACAKLCEGCMNQADPLIPVSTYQSGAFTIAEFLATAIRQRGEK
ncbi:hypothetical protein UFOVP20_18 [uncultured Caudovirales phage]|uniref:Uncharacterized protein n=1 Tax=uncultured Caudovirales phage TaxID=2100421 RepID=A0A6J5KLS1_9CAUD|nr:hypothetical protein UFOVP20_18 [uncultured Caudovirales phage]